MFMASPQYTLHSITQTIRNQLAQSQSANKQPQGPPVQQQSLFLFCHNNVLKSGDSTLGFMVELGELAKYCDEEDHFLYLTLA